DCEKENSLYSQQAPVWVNQPSPENWHTISPLCITGRWATSSWRSRTSKLFKGTLRYTTMFLSAVCGIILTLLVMLLMTPLWLALFTIGCGFMIILAPLLVIISLVKLHTLEKSLGSTLSSSITSASSPAASKAAERESGKTSTS